MVCLNVDADVHITGHREYPKRCGNPDVADCANFTNSSKLFKVTSVNNQELKYWRACLDGFGLAQSGLAPGTHG